MKKILIGALLIAPALWGGMTWVASNKTEETFNTMLTQSNQRIIEAAPILSMEKKSFNKGFISSTAKSVIHIDPDIFDYETPLKINLNHTIYHGPFMLTSDGVKIGTSYIITTLDQAPLEEKTRQAIALIFSGKQPFTSKTRTHFDNSLTESFDMPALTIDSTALETLLAPDEKSTQHFKLNLAGISSEFTTNPEAGFLNGWINTQALNMTGGNGRESFNMSINSSSTQFDIDELYHGAMLLGSMTFNLPEVQWNDKKQSISLKDMSLKVSAESQAELYSQQASIDVANLLVSPNNSPSLFPDSKLHMSFGLKGLERTATRHLIELSQSINQAQVSLLNNNNSSQAQQQLEANINNYLQALGDLVKPGLESNNTIELSNDKGKANIHFDLSYVAAKKLLELKTVKELIISLSAELRINIDKNLVANTAIEQFINSPMSNNAFKNNTTTYTANAILNNGQLDLNGEPIPLLDMLGPSANEPLVWDEYLQ
ncbi:MAG: DUF945 family protein [Methyloprofundus sp.]|nr:DUF945 family protein [Methyloprofundus sp.]